MEQVVYSVIVTYNASKWIDDCLSSINRSTQPVRIIVVDNASDDNTVQLIQNYPEVVLLRQDANHGFGKANNIGISYAINSGATFVFLLNQDATVFPDTIENLVVHASKNNLAGIISPLHLSSDDTQFDPKFIGYVARDESLLISHLYAGTLQSTYSVGFVNAAAWLLSRNCIETVGGFDPLFNMYEEDVDYCMRAAYHKFEILIVPSSKVKHYRGKNPSAFRSPWDRRWYHLNSFSNRIRSKGIVYLKDPYTNFMQQLLLLVSDEFNSLLRAGISLNFHQFAVEVLGSIKVMLEIPLIWKHKRMSIQGGPIWLDELIERYQSETSHFRSPSTNPNQGRQH